jgi:type IV pilus assembly protein PilM
LSKFIKLPPVEAAKIPDIVTYEARQQIPFPLDQVVWSWQRLEGGIEESGFVIDAEVALFAMKRDQVTRALEPFTRADIEVDILQLAPVALSNLAMADLLPPADEIDPDSPPASIVLVSIGVDSTDLIITNGLRIWQRTMPIGGNNFTRALVQGMRMTFAKAENLKRNAARADDPKKVFQTLRPVFNEFASEMQRSLNYFTGQDRVSTVGDVYLVGNAAKLRGLSDFLSKQLQLEVHRLREFKGLEGNVVLKSPAFLENQLAFATTYGLALQGVGAAGIRTNLLPPESLRDRLIRAKRPWAVVAMLGLLVAALVNFLGIFIAWNSYSESLFADAYAAVDKVTAQSSSIQSRLEESLASRNEIFAAQEQLLRIVDRRFQALELIRAVEAMLPRSEPDKTRRADTDDATTSSRLADINLDEIHVDSLDCQYFEDLSVWFEPLANEWAKTLAQDQPETEETADGSKPEQLEDELSPTESANESTSETLVEGEEEEEGPTPQGSGWVIQITGHHYHNEDYHKPYEGRNYLRTTIIENILGEGIQLPVVAGPLAGQSLPVSEFGIRFPILVSSSRIRTEVVADDTASSPTGDSRGRQPPRRRGRSGATGEGGEEDLLELRRYEFVLQFVWQPRTPGAAEILPKDDEEAPAF